MIGRGGMGAVYLAARDDDEYRTHVAIKVLAHGIDTADAIARFRDERQILATLDHPNIVRLLDGGSTDDGLPYLVMEHVVGEPITLDAERRALTVRARVELFRRVCAAVAFAHQRLIVHRDIKPSNILVAGDDPKLLDFGIAKLLAPDDNARTRTGLHRFTPEYASPEQVRGAAPSTSTDVYSLGAVLYHLVAGRPPHDLELGPSALRTILDVDPPRSSAVAPPDRRRALAGDLDEIVAKALRKEPDRRYASVEQLADDLSRYLDGLPVAARAGSRAYRAGKFVRRNRTMVATTATSIALAAATAFSLRQARRADAAAAETRESFASVRKLANSLLFEIDDEVYKLVGSAHARELIVKRALEYLDDLSRRGVDDPALARELATAYTKIGDIQGGTFGPNVNQLDDALASYTKARAIVDALPADDADTRWVAARVGFGTAALAVVKPERAREELARAFAILDSSAAADLDRPRDRPARVRHAVASRRRGPRSPGGAEGRRGCARDGRTMGPRRAVAEDALLGRGRALAARRRGGLARRPRRGSRGPPRVVRGRRPATRRGARELPVSLRPREGCVSGGGVHRRIGRW